MKTLFKLVVFLYSFSTFAQDNKLYRITYYNFNDTLMPEDKKYSAILLSSETQSVSYKLPYRFENAGMKKVSSSQGATKYEYYSEKDTIKVYCYKELAHNRLVFESEFSFVIRASKPYTDSLHPFDWVIHESQKEIGGLVCKKATMSFRGRKYVAWFAETVPLNNGPWKFGGLPGLITEIHDETFTVYWTLHKIEKTNDVLPLVPTKIEGDYADFKKLYKERFLKVKRAIESHGNVEDPNCSDCKGSTTFTSNTIEDLLTDN
ncbi:GLPGLI family protein [Lacibacter cauensis]|uniref:GLPGLI family protein n=1 Tax=Lacibacter cauensis TaxID=510947 RepID=A0A562SS16_9BACT|nr:GLPGLI family protein [Lacibacter cauensis]TWI83918.1 GLPGLI family protein [Lacibacter cauensis]